MATLLIDMDSVLCDLMSKWHERYNEEYNDTLDVSRIKSWESENYVKPECGMKIYSYLDEPGLFLSLEPLPYAIEVMERLHKKHDILIVSSSRTYAYTEKEQWIEKHLPFIGNKNIIFSHRKDMIIGDILFDDAPHNLLAFSETGRIAVAMDYPYNRNINVPRVKDWLAFEKWLAENM